MFSRTYGICLVFLERELTMIAIQFLLLLDMVFENVYEKIRKNTYLNISKF